MDLLHLMKLSNPPPSADSTPYTILICNLLPSIILAESRFNQNMFYFKYLGDGVCMLRNLRRVLWVSQSSGFYLQARFPASQPALFKHLSSDSLLRVRVFDGEPAGVLCLSSGRLKPKRLLGEMTFSVSHIEVNSEISGVCPGSLMVLAKRNRN